MGGELIVSQYEKINKYVTKASAFYWFYDLWIPILVSHYLQRIYGSNINYLQPAQLTCNVQDM